ncbi:MAG: periplasmic heavy metal sensor [Acidobacteria bacterium]|jgi:protein CpxP|nr:MAG: periplasmic heavy metal sensor [Acidobacteriota bacterium]GIU81417.1 MAG: hypothetical protein KatS3mg006_0481 [Pyrinomonadaceae bacterium]
MKRIGLVTFVFVCSLILGSALSFAQKGDGFKNNDRDEIKWKPLVGRIANELGLTDEQKAQIKQIYETEREKMRALKQEMRQIHRQLSEQGKDGIFNEALVTQLASRQAELTKQMIIEKERTKASVFAVLTPEQREKLQQFKTSFKDRFKPRMRQKMNLPENNN